MGLDMYLEGRKYFCEDYNNPENNVTEDGFRLKQKILDIGYWRKEPDLHGYIVQTFANGNDDCQDIELGKEDMLDIIAAVRERGLPHTTGFFFGASCDPNSTNEVERSMALEFERYTIEVLEKAIEWVDSAPPRETRTGFHELRYIVYRASW